MQFSLKELNVSLVCHAPVILDLYDWQALQLVTPNHAGFDKRAMQIPSAILYIPLFMKTLQCRVIMMTMTCNYKVDIWLNLTEYYLMDFPHDNDFKDVFLFGSSTSDLKFARTYEPIVFFHMFFFFTLWCYQMKTFFRVTGPLWRESSGEYPSQWPVTRSSNDWANNRDAGVSDAITLIITSL